jgi:hypothetical protein
VLIGQRQSEEELQKIDGAAMRMETERGLLVCDFSFKRRQKDTWDLVFSSFNCRSKNL